MNNCILVNSTKCYDPVETIQSCFNNTCYVKCVGDPYTIVDNDALRTHLLNNFHIVQEMIHISDNVIEIIINDGCSGDLHTLDVDPATFDPNEYLISSSKNFTELESTNMHELDIRIQHVIWLHKLVYTVGVFE